MNIRLESIENTLGEDLDSRIRNWKIVDAMEREQARQRVLLNNSKLTDTITTINGKTGEITKEDIMSLGVAEKGPVGPPGERGLQGELGPKGKDGQPGESPSLTPLEDKIRSLEQLVQNEIERLEGLMSTSESRIKYVFTDNEKGNAEGTIVVDTKNIDIGDYNLSWIDSSNKKLIDYEEIKKITKEQDIISENYSFIKNNFIPKNATSVGLFKGDALIDSEKIPENKLFNKTKLFSFGQLADTHVDGDGDDEAYSIQDFKSALEIYNKEKVDFVSISGDVTRDGRLSDMQKYKELVDAHSKGMPIYTVRGNHDVINESTNVSLYEQYVETRGDYYERELNGEIFLFLSLKDREFETSGFSKESIDWLKERLNFYKDRRVFLMQHVFVGPVGNIEQLYPWSSFINSQSLEVLRFKEMISHFKNVIFISGHSHLEFSLQRLGVNANFSKRTENMSHRVHVPSGASPRANDTTNEDLPINTYKMHEASQGYVIDVYENHIVLKGIDFVGKKFLPEAQYYIDTTPISVTLYVDKEITNDFSTWEKGSINSTNGSITSSKNSFVSEIVPFVETEDRNILILGGQLTWIRVAYYDINKNFLGSENYFSGDESKKGDIITLNDYDNKTKYFRIKLSTLNTLDSLTIKGIKETKLTTAIANNISTWNIGRINLDTGKPTVSDVHLVSDYIRIDEGLFPRLTLPENIDDVVVALFDKEKELRITLKTPEDLKIVDNEIFINQVIPTDAYYKISFKTKESTIESAKICLACIKKEFVVITGFSYWENGDLSSSYPWEEDHNERIRSGYIPLNSETFKPIVVPENMYWVRISLMDESKSNIKVINDYNVIEPTFSGQELDISQHLTPESKYMRIRFGSATGSQVEAKNIAKEVKFKTP